MRKLVTVFLCGLLVTGNLVVPAQNPATKQVPQVILNRCEGNNSDLAGANQMAGGDGTIIAIARLGDAERSRELNRRRMHNIRVFLAEFWHRDPATVITAEGERVKGYGRVELYVRGTLFIALAVRRNEDLLVGSCIGPDRSLYPYLDQKPRKAARKP
jgi:hypothetical protein